MFSKIGVKIKYTAMIVFWIEFISSIIIGIIFAGDTDGISILFALIGVIIALISSWCLYGFGEIIDKLFEIERNTHSLYVESHNKLKNSPNKKESLSQLLSKGLITQEEYDDAISK